MSKRGQERLLKLCWLLDEYPLQVCQDAAMTRTMKMILPALVYISRITTSATESTGVSDVATLKNSNIKLLQALVDEEDFYGTTKRRFSM